MQICTFTGKEILGSASGSGVKAYNGITNEERKLPQCRRYKLNVTLDERNATHANFTGNKIHR